MGLAAGQHLTAARDHIRDVFLHLFHGVHVDQGAGRDARFQPVTDVQLAHRRRELGGEGIIDTGLHIDAVGANAGLAVVAELGDHRAFNRLIKVGIVEHDEGRVAAQFHGAFQNLIGGLTQQDPAHFGGTREGQLPHTRVFAEFLADVRGARRGDDREHALRHARAFGQDGHGQCGQRGFGGGARNHATAHGQRGADLAGDHGVGEVPWRDGCRHANRLLQDRDALVALVARDRLAIDTLGLFAEPFDEGGSIQHLALGLGQRLAHFGGQDGGQIIGVFDHQIEPLTHDSGALLAGAGGPFVAGLVGHLNRAFGICAGHVGHIGNHVTPRGVGHGKGLAIGGIDPFACDIGLLNQQAGVFQDRTQVCCGIEHLGLPFLGWSCNACLSAKSLVPGQGLD